MMSYAAFSVTAMALELPAAYEPIILEQVRDIREYTANLARDGANEGTLVWARAVESHRGRHGSNWHCSVDDLHCAIVLQPEFPREQYGLMLAVSVIALGNALATHMSPMSALVYGWPNNVSLAGQKLAASWLDAGSTEHGPWLVVSSCVNIQHSPDDLSFNAMSVREAEGSTELTAEVLLDAYCRQFITVLNEWAEKGTKTLLRRWQMRMQDEGSEIRTGCRNDEITRLVGVDGHGNAITRNTDGQKLTLKLGDTVESS